MLTIALPNGTLEARTTALFKEAGIELARPDRCYTVYPDDPRASQMISRATFMRPQIIPLMVEKGPYDLGITGSDWVAEHESAVTVLGKLNYSGRGDREWRVVMVAPEDDPVQRIEDIGGFPTILSEFPNLTVEALWQAGVDAEIVFSYGTTEALIPCDFPYGVCVASTEETLRANGLKIIHVLSRETTVLIAPAGKPLFLEKEKALASLLECLTWK